MPYRPPVHKPRFQPKPVEHRGTAAQRGYGHQHRKDRLNWLAEHPLCENCGRAATVLDHRIPRNSGGADDPSNYRSLCRDCHQSATENYKRTGVNEPDQAGGMGAKMYKPEGALDRPARQQKSLASFRPLGGGPARQVSVGGVSNPADGPETAETQEISASSTPLGDP